MKNTHILMSILAMSLVARIRSNVTPIPEPEIYTRDEPYEVIIENLCPSAPPDDAVECQHSVMLAQGVGHILGEGTGTKVHGDKSLEFITCFSTKIPTFNVNLSMYCFFKGQKMVYEKNFNDLRTKEDFDIAIQELMLKREEMIGAPTFYNYFSELLRVANTAKDNLLAGKGALEAGQQGVLLDQTIKSGEFNLSRQEPMQYP